MEINSYNNETKLKEKNISDKNIERGKENDINKINDNNTTKEDDSFYTFEEAISYCSSPKSGLVSIKKTKYNNNAFIPFLNYGSEICNITNTITFKIDIMKKEMDLTEVSQDVNRSNTGLKEKQVSNKSEKSMNTYHNDSTQNNTNNQNENKVKSIFKKRIKKSKENNDELAKNLKKKYSKGKKKRTRKCQIEDNNKMYEPMRVSEEINKELIKKAKKKKSQKLNKVNDLKKKLLQKKYEMDEKMEKHKNRHKDSEEGISPQIIILDFSSSGNCEDDEDSIKDKNARTSQKEDKHIDKKVNNIKNNNLKFNKIENNEFFIKRHRTKNEDAFYAKTDSKKELKSEKKIVLPKFKNSCFLVNTYKMGQNKLGNTRTDQRRFSVKVGNNHIIPRKSLIKFEENRRLLKKDKKRKPSDNFYVICSTKDFQHKEENIGKGIVQKENFRKSTKCKAKYKNFDKDKDKEKEKEKDKEKEKEKDKDKEKEKERGKDKNKDKEKDKEKDKDKEKEKGKDKNKDKSGDLNRKDSNKSCHNTPNKKFKHIITHNYDITKKLNIEKNLNLDMRKKPSENSSLTNTPKNLGPKKATYASNRNLTNIKISSQAVDNKDIHLEMNGKQETIINYTNQEMVDDETEYMLECFKVLLKLDKSKQPRCRSKVDFNWGNSDKKKKIALFDLDETLVHCTKGQNGINGDSVKIKLPTNKVVNVGLNIRPHWKEALEIIKPFYHIVVYTASHQSYADAVLDYLDKENKYFQYRLYRNHCVQCDVDGIKFYVKDLDTLNEKYNLKDVVIIDNSVLSFAYHLNNGIPIVPYIEQKEDSQLIMLAYYLLSISHYDDLIAENKKHVNIEHFLLQVKNLEDEEEEEIEEEENKDDNNNKNEEEKNNDNNAGNKDNNENLYEDKTEDNDKADKNKEDNYDSKSCGTKIMKQIKKQSSLDSKIYGKKLTLRKSQKALEIANDMKKNMNDVYSKNYNEE